MIVKVHKSKLNVDKDEMFMLGDEPRKYDDEIGITPTEYQSIKDDSNFSIEVIEFVALKEEDKIVTPPKDQQQINRENLVSDIIISELEIFDAIYSQLKSSYPNEQIINSANAIYGNTIKRIEYDTERKTET